MKSPPASVSLDQIDLFQDLSPAENTQVNRAARQRKLVSGATIFQEADPAEYIYVLESGRIRLTQITPDGQQIILHHIAPGEAFGVVALLSNIPYPVTAQAVTESVILAWDRATLIKLMNSYPRISLNAIKILSDRVRDFQDRIRELTTERVERRIARALLRLARQAGRKEQDGVRIDLPLTRQDLAEMTGTTLFTVSRTLSLWESQGLVHSRREQVTIVYPHGLVSIAEDFAPRKHGQNLL